MEKKLQIALCALLLFINWGSTVQGQDSMTSPMPLESTDTEKSDTFAAAGSMPGPVLQPQATKASPGSSDSSNASSSNNTHTEAEPASPTALDHYPSTSSPPDTPKGTTSTDLATIPTLPGKNTSLTEQPQPQPTLAPSEAATTHISRSATITHSVRPSSKQTHITPPPPTTTSPHSVSSHAPTHQTSSSSHPTHPSTHRPKTTVPTSAPTSESPKEADADTAVSIQSSSTASTHRETTVSPVTSLPSPRSDAHPETSRPTHAESTFSPPSSSSGQAKPHVDSPSQLNMDDATVVHEPATPDPLLAGLVSAFIITAVIITLLLFLKLRRRDNRPEFRRLQDLPMDDMMEDTPLSMYSY